MMLFGKKALPELISIHIPKTAGTSFRNILKSVYSDKEVVRFDISLRGAVRMNEVPWEEKKLPPCKVLHGHFSYEALVSKFDVTECPVITWLRDPVQRVASNYYYLESRLQDILQEEKRNLHILEKMQRSLSEFAHAEINRNRQWKFLKGIPIQKLAFVGLVEHFEDDLPRLAKALGWKNKPDILYHNVTAQENRIIPDALAEEIRSLNSLDEELYREAIEWRKQNAHVYAGN